MVSLTRDHIAAAKELVATDEALLPLFPVLERAFILALKEYFKG